MFAASAFRQLTSVEESERWVLHTHEVIERSQVIGTAVADAGRARRAFAQTRDEAQLVVYRAARDRATEAQQMLRRLTADNPSQQGLVELIAQVVAARLDQLDASIRDARVREFSADSEVTLTNAAVVLTGRLAELLARFEAEERRLLDERSRTMHAGSVSAKLTLVVGFAASTVILVLAFLLSRREVKRRNQEAALRANAYLVSAVDSIEDAFAIYDEHDRIVLTNSVFRALFGGNLERPIVGLTFEEVLELCRSTSISRRRWRARTISGLHAPRRRRPAQQRASSSHR